MEKGVQSYSTLMIDLASMTLERRYWFDRQRPRQLPRLVPPFISPLLIPSPDPIMNPHGFPFRMMVVG